MSIDPDQFHGAMFRDLEAPTKIGDSEPSFFRLLPLSSGPARRVTRHDPIGRILG